MRFSGLCFAMEPTQRTITVPGTLSHLAVGYARVAHNTAHSQGYWYPRTASAYKAGGGSASVSSSAGAGTGSGPSSPSSSSADPHAEPKQSLRAGYYKSSKSSAQQQAALARMMGSVSAGADDEEGEHDGDAQMTHEGSSGNSGDSSSSNSNSGSGSGSSADSDSNSLLSALAASLPTFASPKPKTRQASRDDEKQTRSSSAKQTRSTPKRGSGDRAGSSDNSSSTGNSDPKVKLEAIGEENDDGDVDMAAAAGAASANKGRRKGRGGLHSAASRLQLEASTGAGSLARVHSFLSACVLILQRLVTCWCRFSRGSCAWRSSNCRLRSLPMSRLTCTMVSARIASARFSSGPVVGRHCAVAVWQVRSWPRVRLRPCISGLIAWRSQHQPA